MKFRALLVGCLAVFGVTCAYAAEIGPTENDTTGGETELTGTEGAADGLLVDGGHVHLRVLLSAHLPVLTIECDRPISVSNPDGDEFGRLVSPVTVAVRAGRIAASDMSGSISGAVLKMTPEQDGWLRFQEKSYRGAFLLSISSHGGVLLVNAVDLESYLRGVVPAEIPALWPPEAVKAQAVAARTYAIQRAYSRRNASYDVTADVSDQLYLGVAKEHPASDLAIAATAGLVITYGGEPIIAYYHACSGGQTRDGPQPYLSGVESPEESPYDVWQREFTLSELAEFLDAAGFAAGSIHDVHTVSAPDVSDGYRVAFVGIRARIELTPSQVRGVLGRDKFRSPRFRIELVGGEAEGLAELRHWMRTTLISARDETEVKVRGCVVTAGRKALKLTGTHYVLSRVQKVEKVRFVGGGYGHGLGMSQYGAKYMADHGSDWREIIHHYYAGVDIVNVSEIGRMPAF